MLKSEDFQSPFQTRSKGGEKHAQFSGSQAADESVAKDRTGSALLSANKSHAAFSSMVIVSNLTHCRKISSKRRLLRAQRPKLSERSCYQTHTTLNSRGRNRLRWSWAVYLGGPLMQSCPSKVMVRTLIPQSVSKNPEGFWGFLTLVHHTSSKL